MGWHALHSCVHAGQGSQATKCRLLRTAPSRSSWITGSRRQVSLAIRVHLHEEWPAAPAPGAASFAAAPFDASGDPALRAGAFWLLWAKKRYGLATHCAERPCCDSALVQHTAGYARYQLIALCRKVLC